MSPKIFFLTILYSIVALSQSNPTDSSISQKLKDTLYYTTDEVVVSGTRINQKIIDVPYSVNTIPSAQFKFDKKTAVNDVLSTIPGVFMQPRYGNHDVRISIRGFGSRSNSGIRGVRILLDGIPESEPDGQTRIEAIDFNAVGNIELVKGNSSSLYTNSPGGVINFVNNVYFQDNYFQSHNEFGSYDLIRSGFKTGVRTPDYGMLLTYTYHDYAGYREHSADHWNIFNAVFETIPNDHSKLEILAYFVDGVIRLPGSLKKEEVAADPTQAAQREEDFDFRRITTKGRLGIRYNNFINSANEIEITGYTGIKYFERAQTDYRIMNRYVLGGSAKYVNRTEIADHKNDFSLGGDLFYQTGPVETYENINGQRTDVLTALSNETISNSGFYLLNNFEILQDRLSLLLSGRYDNVVFDQKNQLLQAQNDIRKFSDFTPKAALNFKLTPHLALYTSYGLGFDTPAANELDNYPTSSDPSKMINPDLQAQKSKNFEFGIKGNIVNPDNQFLNRIFFDITFFNSLIEDEIVPFEVYSSYYYRNSAETRRTGLEAGTDMELLRGLNMRLAYTYSDFSYNEYSAITIELDSTGQIIESAMDFSGNIVPSVPIHNFVIALQYDAEISEAITGFIKGNYQYVEGMYVDDANSDKTGAYQLVNGVIGFDTRISQFSLLVSAGINNILDREYVSFVNINSASLRFYEPGLPSNVFGSVILRYTL